MVHRDQILYMHIAFTNIVLKNPHYSTTQVEALATERQFLTQCLGLVAEA
jgi:hypothetical protein